MSMPRFAPCVGRCCENLSTGPAVANGSRLHAKGSRTCPEFGHHSIQMQPTPPEFHANATERFPNSPELHANATHIRHDFGQYSIQMQPKPPEFHANATCFFAEFVRITFKCKPILS